jgi:hypothetical protein
MECVVEQSDFCGVFQSVTRSFDFDNKACHGNNNYANSFLAKSCLILAERLGFASILNFVLYFLIMRADTIPMITPGAVQVMINTKEGVFSGKNLGTIFTQKAVIAAEYAPIILPA